MWTDWAASWTPPNIALAVFGSLVAAGIIWTAPRVVRLAIKHAWGFTKKEVEPIEVAVARYRVSEPFDRVTFQNYIAAQVRRSGTDTWFDTFIVFGLGVSLAAAVQASLPVAVAYTVFGVVFVGRLFLGVLKHVRFLMIEDELYRHVSLERTAALMAESSDTTAAAGTQESSIA